MAKRDANRVSSVITATEIIKLGNKLASIASIQDQKQYFESFLHQRLLCEAFLWLKTPPKPIISEADLTQFPFDPNSVFTSADKHASESQVLEVSNKFWLLTPIFVGENEIGKIILKQNTPFDEQVKASLKNLSGIAGLAISTTLQTQLENWRQKQLSLVQSVTAQISQITHLDILTQQITDLIQQTFNYYYLAVFLINEDTERLLFTASAGPDQFKRPDFERETHPGFALGEHMIGYVAKTGQELIANDVTKEPRYKKDDSLPETESEAVIPLKIDTRILGVFDIQSQEKNAFDEHDLLVLRALADNISIAIESAQLYNKVQSRADQLTTVSEVSRAITSILDIDELLKKIVDLILARFGYPYVHLYTVDPTQRKIFFKAGSGERTPLYSKAGVSFDLDAEKGILPWVVNHNQTKRINDTKTEPLFIESPYAQKSAGSEMAVPLSFGGEVLGVLDIQSHQKNAFTQDDQQLMETLADNIANAIRNARLYRSEKWRRQIAESLRDVAGLLSDNTAIDDVLEEILNQLHKNLPCDIAGIWLFNPPTQGDTPIASRDLYLRAYKTAKVFTSEELGHLTFTPDAWVKNALNQRHPTIRQKDDSIGPIAKHYQMSQDYSSISAPLLTGDEILGMLTLVHHTPNRYGQESIKITSAFASYAAIAIRNTYLYNTSQEQAWISTILLQVAQATQSLTDLDELVATIVRLTPLVVGIKGCALFLREPASEVFSLYALYGIGASPEEIVLDQPIPSVNSPILDELLLTKGPLRINDPAESFDLPERFTRQMSKDTLILLPLIARDEVLGAFLLANDAEVASKDFATDVIDEERLNIIQGIIQQTAIAVENIRLLEAKQEEAYVSTVLLQAAQAVVSGTDLQDTLDSIVHIMPILVGIDTSAIYLWDNDDDRFRTSHATIKGATDENDLIGVRYSSGDFPMLDTVYQKNSPIVYPFVDTTLPPEDWDLVLPDEGQTDPSPVLKSRYPLLMGFPLSVKGETYGVLLALDKNYATNRDRRFELLWGIAQQASLAIQNDRLNKEMLDRHQLEREFQLAREIQQTFLPEKVPQIPGWKIDVRWETARQVGGDFYDYFLLPDGRLAFVIADVSDKGLAASLYMTVTRTLLRAIALESHPPAETLELVNESLLLNSQNGLFVTTFYGVLNLKDGTLTYTIAGHNPPFMLCYASKEVIEFEKGGIAIGAMPDIQLPQRQIKINPGDCLVLYTDGVTEAFNTMDQMYGEKRLKNVLASAIGETAQTVLEILDNDLEKFRGDAPLSDDTTVLAICRSFSLADKNRDVGAP